MGSMYPYAQITLKMIIVSIRDKNGFKKSAF